MQGARRPKQVNNLLRYEREKRGWSQAKLAEILTVDPTMISRWERGEREPASEYRERLCEIFEKNAIELGFIAPLQVPQLQNRHQEGIKQMPTLPAMDYYTPASLESLNVGGMTINLIVLARGCYKPSEIHCFYDDTPIQLPPEFDRMKKELIHDLEEKKAKGETKLPYNSAMYKLKEFDVGYREVVDGKEIPVLRLKFGPTDYFTQMVTDLNIGNPIRERYAKSAFITEHPVPEFSTILGINLNLITKDGYLILTERSSRAFVAGGRLHTSVGENLLRPQDAGSFGSPDPFYCALRGAQEELGLILNYEEVVFSSFTVIPDLCQYSLISTVQIQETRAEVERIRHLATSVDKWESRHLLFYPHNPDSIAQFAFSTWDRWFNVALAAAVLSLLDAGYSQTQVDMAFSRARSR